MGNGAMGAGTDGHGHMTPKVFIIHLSKLEDNDSSMSMPYGKTLIEMLSRNVYFILNHKGRTKFESHVCKSRNFRNLSRILEPLVASKMKADQHLCMEELCPALKMVHAIRERFRELPQIEETIASAGEDMLAKDLHGNVELVELLCRRLQFDSQKLLWNMFLGNRAFLEERDNSAWEALGDADKVVTLIIWICFLNLLLHDKKSESYKYFHTEDAFMQYASPERFRMQWLRFKAVDQEHRGVLTYRMNSKVLRMLMQQGLSLDMAILKCLQEFDKVLHEMPRQVESFAHFYYGKPYADLIEILKSEHKESAEKLNALNGSGMPPRIVLAAGIFTGGFLLHQLNYIPGAKRIAVEKKSYENELKSLESCTSANLRVLSAVRSQARQHHKFNRMSLVRRIVEELEKTEEEAEQDVVALLWYMREGVPMLIHRNFRSLVPMMLTLDWYQSGHEANSFDPSRSVPRDEWELKISAGHYKANITTMEEKRERPKYGALNVVQDVLGINGGVFYGTTYFTLKNVRKLATISFTDTSSDAVHGVEANDDVCSMYSGSECDLGTLDYAAGVICGGWSKNFLRVAIERAYDYIGTPIKARKTRRKLEKEYSSFMGIPGMEDGIRQYDEIQIHGQIFFADNVESITVCKPFIPDPLRGKTIRHDGKLVMINPLSDYSLNWDTSPAKRIEAGKEVVGEEPEHENDDYYLLFEGLSLLDDFDGPTPAFDKQVSKWDDEKKEQFRQHILNQQSQLIALGALVRFEIPDYGSKFCFHLKRCLDCIREKYPSMVIRRIVTNPETFEFEFEGGCRIDDSPDEED